MSGIVRGVIGGVVLVLAVVGALVVPSLIVRPGADFREVPVAVPAERGLSVVRAAARPTAAPHDRQNPPTAPAARPKLPRVALTPRPTPAAAPAARPGSRPPAAPTPAPVPAPVPAPAPTTPAPAPSSPPAPALPPEREILVVEPAPPTPPQGKPVVDEPEPAKHEGEKKGHEKNEPQRNGHDDEHGGPKQDRGPRD